MNEPHVQYSKKYIFKNLYVALKKLKILSGSLKLILLNFVILTVYGWEVHIFELLQYNRKK